MARDHDRGCAFVNDELDATVLRALATGGTRGVVLRCAGFNNVDLDTAAERGLRVLRVPGYSPNAVAEHTLALVLALNPRRPPCLKPGARRQLQLRRPGRIRPGAWCPDQCRGRSAGLKSGRIGSLALDVYVEEARLFFGDRSSEVIDDVFARLLTCSNVLITAHQAFLTRHALAAIAETTLANAADVVAGRPSDNEVVVDDR